MEAFEPGTGSIPDIHRRLGLWGQRSGRGMARVEYSSEFARQRVVALLRATLFERGIAYSEIVLPRLPSAADGVAELLDRLMQCPPGVVSIVGFASMFNNESTLADDLRLLNFNRERFLAFPGRQIWWTTPAFFQRMIHAIPDLNSYFSPRLCLSEVVFAEAPRAGTIAVTSSIAEFEDARSRSQQLVRQFEAARQAGAENQALLTTYLLPALEALAEVGAQQELRDLTQQFEGLLGSLKRLDSPDMANSLNRLATLYREQGRYEQAEPLYLRALQLRRSLLGETHPHVAASLNNLAELYRAQGRYEQAEPLYLQALELRRSLLGETHPAVARSLNNLARLYESQGRYAEAEPCYLRSLAISFEKLGADHPNTQTFRQNFLYFLQQVIQENRIAELSDDPMTRSLCEAHLSLLQQLQNPSE